jgi:hypothetical protein
VGTQDRKAADRAPVNITKAIRVVLNRAIRLVPDCRQAGFLGPFEVGRFGIVSAAERKMLVAEMQDSLRAKLGVSAQDLPSDGDINQPATRNAISKLRTVAPAINPELGSAIDAPILARIFAR